MILDCSDPLLREEVLTRAAEVVRAGKVLVLPTDTVYGVGADAFDDVAVAMVLAAKHRGREMPPPVLVPNARTVTGLATDVPMYAKILMRQFWPGALTLVLRAQPTLAWDLGETNGTVALRMPDDEVALALLAEVGPLAVTSANVTGRPAATTAAQAQEQLGGAVALYLDAGERSGGTASTIVDCTGPEPVVLRHGALAADRLREVLGTTVLHDAPPVVPEPEQAGQGEQVEQGEGATVENAAGEVGTGESGTGTGEGGPAVAQDSESQDQESQDEVGQDRVSQAPAGDPQGEAAATAGGHAGPVPPGEVALIGSVRPSGVRVLPGSVREVAPPGREGRD